MNKIANKPRKVFAKIHWLSAAEGGRKHPPQGPHYSTVARFANQADKWPQEAWSLVAEFTEVRDDLFCREAEIRFLSADAPADLLQPGSQFELYEGRRVVARGEIVESVLKSSSASIMLSQPAAVLQEVAA